MQQELDDMKLKNNLLQEEITELQSRLDTTNKQLRINRAENSLLVKKHLELKKQRGTAVKFDLVCIIIHS